MLSSNFTHKSKVKPRGLQLLFSKKQSDPICGGYVTMRV